MKILLALLCVATVVGCSDPTPGATDAPPPVGGPPKSDRHPPGLTEGEKSSQR